MGAGLAGGGAELAPKIGAGWTPAPSVRIGNRGAAISVPAIRLYLAEALIERDAPGDLGKASSVLDEAEQLAHELKQRPHVARSLAIRARLLDRLGDPEGRDRARAEAISLGREMDARGLLADLEAEQASTAA